jgi:hypothetical protein
MIGACCRRGRRPPAWRLGASGGRRVTATGRRLDRGLEPAPAAHQRPTSALATPSIPLNRRNRPPVTPACGEERRWSVQPLQRMDSGSRRMFALSGSPHDPLAAQPVRAATYETLIADTDCGRLITWVGGGERGLLRNERFWTAPRRHETWGRPSQASPGLSRVSSHPGDGTTRVLGCAQGWTIRWRAVSALGTRLALKA